MSEFERFHLTSLVKAWEHARQYGDDYGSRLAETMAAVLENAGAQLTATGWFYNGERI